jgi:AraC family L-rhamnose operon regulatory protein RhaS
MREDQLTTIGRENHPGREVRIFCARDITALEHKSLEDRFRIVYVKEGFCIFSNSGASQIITSPSILYLNNHDTIELNDASSLKLDMMFFDPICFERYIPFDDIQSWKDSLAEEDLFFFRPFFERTDTYIGACPTNYLLGNRIQQLIALTDMELTEQNNHFWPCRSRSYFIELLLAANSIYNEDSAHEKVYFGEMNEEIKELINWLHTHYNEKITMDVVTKQFHTNKTTLNQKFKSVIGTTVMDYVSRLRMQIACSLLRKTYLTINEIMERAGYKDDAHFLRTFRKYGGCTPSEYRSRFENL